MQQGKCVLLFFFWEKNGIDYYFIYGIIITEQIAERKKYGTGILDERTR